MKSFIKLKANIKKDISSLPIIKTALLADSSTQLLAIALKGMAIEKQYSLYLPDFGHNQIDLNINNTNSDLFSFSPEFIIFFYSYNSLANEFYSLNDSEKTSFSQIFLNKIRSHKAKLDNRLSANIIFFNIPEISDFSLGNYSTQTVSSLVYQLRMINSGLVEIAKESDNFYLFDFNSYLLRFGYEKVFDPKLIFSSDITLNIDILPSITSGLTDIILASKGKVNKCIILDLDNTLWGGIIGDDGVENIEIGDFGKGKAYNNFQKWLKELNDRGIILAICSKNEKETVINALDNHPDMILRSDNFAVIKANWNNKVDNINAIRNELNISFDSIIFIDDNPVERDLVSKFLPEIIVPDLPEDCAYYTEYLKSLNLFETISYSENDKHRANQYKEQSKRVNERENYYNENDFLESLQMKSKIHSDNDSVDFIIPRLAQLSQRTNQFNLRTVRYTEKDFNKIISNDKHSFIAFDLEDKFGSYGLVSTVTLFRDDNEFFIDNWVMSCRVFARGLEDFIINCLVEYSELSGIKIISGEYIPTNKNMPVKDLYKKLGFTFKDNKWYLEISNFKKRVTHITSE